MNEEEFGNLFDAIATTVDEGVLVINYGMREGKRHDNKDDSGFVEGGN